MCKNEASKYTELNGLTLNIGKEVDILANFEENCPLMKS